MRLALALVALAACSDPPPLEIKYALKTDGTQLCYANLAQQTPAHSCTDVSMLCPSVLDLRIVSAADTTHQFVKVCEPITGRMNLCSIAGINLPAPTSSIAEQTLEVQVAVYRDSDLAHDDAMNPICPDGLQFGADGLPESSAPSPAVGGRAFYHPGDTSTVVELGCTDESAIQDPTCVGMNSVLVTATVNDFDSDVSVAPSLADSLSVSIGEPQPVINGMTTQYVLQPTHTRALDRTVVGPIPGWGGAIDLALMSTACLEVLEDVPQATPSLVCKPVTMGQAEVDLPGIRVSKTTLDQILAADTLSTFPPQGLVIGIVLNDLGQPFEGITVTTSDTTAVVSYLAANRQGLIGGATSSNGIFLSTTAAFGSTFTAVNGMNQASAFGGLVEGKVTVVVLQFTQPTKP
jgi:hypothetical protein